MPTNETQARDEALAHRATFCTYILPRVLRRLAGWHGLHRANLADLADDVGQEIAVDCLEHTHDVLALPLRARHSRWLRMLDRWVYRQGSRQRRPGELRPDLPAPTSTPDHTTAAAVPPDLVTMSNGRINLVASAERRRTSVRLLRRDLQSLAAELGRDRAHDRFWRRRLAEAMTGLGADLLRAQVALRLLGRRPSPAPELRWRRLHRVGRRLPLREATPDDRRRLRPWLRHRCETADAPRRLLAHAVELAPDRAAGWLWHFEERCASWDLPAAAAALRGCRQFAEPARGRVALARARLLEMRGRRSAAVSLLRRAAARWPFEGNLRQALAEIEGASPARHG